MFLPTGIEYPRFYRRCPFYQSQFIGLASYLDSFFQDFLNKLNRCITWLRKIAELCGERSMNKYVKRSFPCWQVTQYLLFLILNSQKNLTPMRARTVMVLCSCMSKKEIYKKVYFSVRIQISFVLVGNSGTVQFCQAFSTLFRNFLYILHYSSKWQNTLPACDSECFQTVCN